MPANLLELEGPWTPGSFTKNFSWGRNQGLRRLYDSIRAGFAGELAMVHRAAYLNRVGADNLRNLVPVNFFLFNSVKNGASTIDVDELVFQALTSHHSPRFDKLALFAFNFSRVGVWKGQQRGQRYPAAWATSYIVEQVANKYEWQVDRVDAQDIDQYLHDLNSFSAKTSHGKVATNLNYLYAVGGLAGIATQRIERWWVDALFLALDRIIADRATDGMETPAGALPHLLTQSQFFPLTGGVSPEKSFAMAHLIGLYTLCGGRQRFDPDQVRELVSVELPLQSLQLPNDDRPQGAMHPTNPRILKTIPRGCAELAKVAGFRIVMADDLDAFDPDVFIRDRAQDAVAQLRTGGVRPTLTPEELHRLTRGE